MIGTLLTWPAAFGAYLAFAGTLSGNELATGAVVATLTSLCAERIRARSEVEFAWRGDALVPMFKAFAGIAPATLAAGAQLLTAIAGRQPGRPIMEPFHYGATDDPRERSRRAIAVLSSSLTPDKFVVRVESRRDAALLHQIGESARALDPQWLT